MGLDLLIWGAIGLAIGLILWLLDRRFASFFAELAGDESRGETGPLTTAFLIISPAVVNVVLVAHLGSSWRDVYLLLAAATWLWITTIDYRWRIIPNRIVYPSSLVALVASPLVRPEGIWPGLVTSLIGLTVAGGVFLLFFVLSLLLYRHAGAFGAGDVKLAAYVGLVLGFPGAVTALFLATLAGAILAIGWGIVRRSRKADFPYGPAIVAGAIASVLLTPAGWSG